MDHIDDGCCYSDDDVFCVGFVGVVGGRLWWLMMGQCIGRHDLMSLLMILLLYYWLVGTLCCQIVQIVVDVVVVDGDLVVYCSDIQPSVHADPNCEPFVDQTVEQHH